MFLEGGVVHQHVDVREPFQHLADGLLAKALLAHVAGDQQAALAFRFHVALRFVGVRMFVQVDDGDVREQGFCQDAVRQVMDKFNHIDVLVNNAAFQEHAESLLDLSEERFDLTMKTNVYGYFHMAKACLLYTSDAADE